jgi:NodT family efflux transporter outer membrane factor (OMF) lipoprotein
MPKYSGAWLGLVWLLAGCDLAPHYHVPVVAVPVSYKAAGAWQVARPADAIPRGQWWTMFGDDQLNALEGRIDSGNPTLAAALAAYDQARAYAGEAEAGLFPQLSVGGHVNTDRQSNRRPLRGGGQPNQYLDNGIDAQAQYEVDLWDRVANTVKASRAAAQASAADLETTRLSLHAELASDYITLRGLDAQSQVLTQAVAAFEQALGLTQTLFNGRIVSAIDVSRAQSQLSTAQSQLTDTASRRALLEHAIAVLVGVPPAELTLPPAPWDMQIVEMDAGLPSDLLERRPDIASAERQIAAANATIGVARAAFYPTLSLSLIYGLQNTGFNIFSLPNEFWAVGPGLSLPLFEGGLRHAEEAATIAEYRLAVANYRQTVLSAFQDVEDDLSDLHLLAQEAQQDQQAADAAAATVNMSTNLYRDGAVSYLDVVVAQTAALQAQQAVVNIRTRRVAASVRLVRDLGGGWSRGDLQAAATTTPSLKMP